MDFAIREIRQPDIPFLWKMLYQCLYVHEGKKPFSMKTLQKPEISKYASNWGRYGDLGLIAENQSKKPLCLVKMSLFLNPFPIAF